MNYQVYLFAAQSIETNIYIGLETKGQQERIKLQVEDRTKWFDIVQESKCLIIQLFAFINVYVRYTHSNHSQSKSYPRF